MWKRLLKDECNSRTTSHLTATLVVAASLVGMSFVPSPIVAQIGGNVEGQINAHLNAGEFGPALALANNLANPAQRDMALAAVARAQAAGGAQNAALGTAGSMSDDRLRTAALDGIGAQPVGAWMGRGGGSQADFDTLIDLITSTIAPQSWDTVGGPGAIDSFPGGVYVDASGLMKQISLVDGGRNLAQVRQMALQSCGNQDVRTKSQLRKVSLTRLEKQIQALWATGQPPTETMKVLAGLQKVKYVLVYPDTRDIVIAGPAGDWALDAEGRKVNVDTNRPVLHLDDLIEVLRNAINRGGQFTCSITPRQQNLAAAQAFLNESAKTPLPEGQRARESWLKKIRDHVGKQKIEVQGIDPRTRAARVIVEADYRMKLVGMGLEEGVFGVTSYLDSIVVPAGAAPPPMSVLRWWFTMDYNAIRATPTRDAFEIRGQGVKVLSENEMLTARGARIHTGKSDELNEQFAHSFTKHFEALAAKYPIYAELQNVFDLALVSAVIVAEDLPGQVGWHLTHFGDPQRYQVELAPAPSDVETVINHRVIRKKHILAGVSGGVSVDPSKYVQRPAIQVDDYGVLRSAHEGSVPKDLPHDAWWWD